MLSQFVKEKKKWETPSFYGGGFPLSLAWGPINQESSISVKLRPFMAGVSRCHNKKKRPGTFFLSWLTGWNSLRLGKQMHEYAIILFALRALDQPTSLVSVRNIETSATSNAPMTTVLQKLGKTKSGFCKKHSNLSSSKKLSTSSSQPGSSKSIPTKQLIWPMVLCSYCNVLSVNALMNEKRKCQSCSKANNNRNVLTGTVIGINLQVYHENFFSLSLDSNNSKSHGMLTVSFYGGFFFFHWVFLFGIFDTKRYEKDALQRGIWL